MRTNNFLNAVMLIIFLSGCDLFVADPTIRLNENDSSRQITSFTAVSSGDTSAVTMWNWIPPENWLASEERIEEIKIIHSTIGYQYFNIPFAGETFTDKTVWKFEWTDLDPDKTHYFSLFLKNEEGNWFPSYRMKVDLPGESISSVIFSRIDSLNIDDTYIQEWLDDPDTTLEIGPLKWAVLAFDIPDDVYIQSAEITLSVTAGSISDISFIPVNGFLDGDGETNWKNLSDGNILRNPDQISYSSAFIKYDITQVLRSAVATPGKTILIKTDASSFNLDNNASAPYITADIIE